MLPFSFANNSDIARKILCLGAHSDDIEIGAGGTLLQLLSENQNIEVVWAVFSAAGTEREREARKSADLFLKGAKHKEVVVHGFRDGFFPYEGAKVKDCFEDLKKRIKPDLIFTHYRDDRHQDHRVMSDLTWNTWRNHLILEYEIPKYDGDLGQPNLFVPLRREFCEQKAKNVCDIFQTQANKAWLTEDTFYGLMRLRGMECVAPQNYAEAFYCRKIVMETRPNDVPPL